MAVGHVDVVLAPPFPLAEEAVEVDCNGTTTRVDPSGIGCDFIGNIEVEAVRDRKDGEVMIERIIFSPLETTAEPPLVPEQPDTIPEDESFMGSFVGSFFDMNNGLCGDTDDCKCLPISPKKSALKKNHEVAGNVGRNVSFSNLEIREYSMTLGDHPSARSGPPMSLDWEYTPKSEIVALDAYERARQPRRGRKRLRMSLLDRENILVKQKGFSYSEIKDAWAEALEVRKQRLETIRRSPQSEMMDEAWESTSRKFLRLFGCETL